MPAFRFVHAADLHLDSPFQGIREIDAGIADELKESTFAAFSQIVDLCLNEQVDFLLIAGDVYDGTDRSLRAQLRFRNELERLSNAGISAYIIHGNHDPLDGWRANLVWPEHVHVFGGDGVDRIECVRDREVVATIYGTSYPRRDVTENLALRYKRHSDDPFAIGLLHANVGGDPGHEAYAPCELAHLLNNSINYWALGHIHKPQILHQATPLIVYAGNPQGRHPGETGERGCYLVRVDAQGVPTPQFVATDVIRWVIEEVSTEELDNEQDLLDELESCCDDMRSREAGRSVVCRLQLTGRTVLHRILRKSGFIDDIIKELRDHFTQSHPFVWIERIEDRTRSSIDVTTRAKGEDFIGDFLRLAQQYPNDPDRLRALKEKLVPLFHHRVGRKYLHMPDDDMLRIWIDEAMIRALDMMVEDE